MRGTIHLLRRSCAGRDKKASHHLNENGHRLAAYANNALIQTCKRKDGDHSGEQLKRSCSFAIGLIWN